MTVIAVVGSEEKCWTEEQKITAKGYINKLVAGLRTKMLLTQHTTIDTKLNYKTILLSGDILAISGHSPKEGVDIWFEQACQKQNLPFKPYPPDVDSWSDSMGKKGYKTRNMEMAMAADIIIEIEPIWIPRFGENHKLTEGFRSYRRSGAAWVVSEARKLKKQTYLVVIE